ncbi:protein FAM110C [Genypterus blacodes]|uniref:protein FAM110C n=1 Tax=Genypterus blacodes TaxID=154954 RepID=UPI003F774562
METINDVDTTKILEKGPEYLRKQMELESETKGGMSAVERLAASKTKYVKSQHVHTQEPVISLGSASVSSTGSSNWSSTRSGKQDTGRNSPVATSDAQRCSPEKHEAGRRSSSKKRPDSILLYRQKCELLKGSTNHWKHNRTHGRVRKNSPLVETTDVECKTGGTEKCSTPEESAKDLISNTAHSQSEQPVQPDQPNMETTAGTGGVVKKPGPKRVVEVQRRCGRGVSRSHSDISSRYSKNFADFDAFFKYCGLDGEVIESLGKENFSARSDEIAKTMLSVSISTSDDGVSADCDGLMEDELREKVRQGTSVIERNARIIKWLYSCKNAKESGKKLRDLD